MSISLKDQLLGLGYKAAPEPPKKPRPESPKPAAGRADAKRSERKAGQHAKGRDERGPRRDARPNRPPQGKPAHRPGGPKPEFDLGKAYAMRAQKEKDERIAAEAAKQEEARLRREARAKLAELLAGKALNDAAAEQVRHFEYGGKIKRVYVTPEQLVKLNAGELGVVQSEGRYVLVTTEVLAQVKEVFAPAVALEVDPNAPAPADDYSDPKFQIPDDLAW